MHDSTLIHILLMLHEIPQYKLADGCVCINEVTIEVKVRLCVCVMLPAVLLLYLA